MSHLLNTNHPLNTHINTSSQRPLLPPPLNTLYHHPLSTPSITTPSQHPLLPPPITTSTQHPLLPPPLNTPYHHPLSTQADKMVASTDGRVDGDKDKDNKGLNYLTPYLRIVKDPKLITREEALEVRYFVTLSIAPSIASINTSYQHSLSAHHPSNALATSYQHSLSTLLINNTPSHT